MSGGTKRLFALKANARTIARARRWIAHLENRIAYERAMLDEQGATALLARKPKSAKAQLPLCNYRTPGGLTIENQWNRGEMIHYPQVEMTQADYAKIHTDYKGTRVVGHSHRVRTTMQRHSLVCVFLTDSKVHPIPEAKDKPEPRVLPPVPLPTYRPAPDPVEAQMSAMKESLRAGVAVVSAPQLFPTPANVAKQLIDLADIQPGDRVLEPSAGTGAILAELTQTTDKGGPVPVAIEINPSLVQMLRQRFPLVSVQCADFLSWEPDEPFTVIVMNPPFAGASDIRHIQHARKMLAPGGKLVAVCAAGPRQRAAFESEGNWIDLPAGTFKEQGTNVNTAIVVLDAVEPLAAEAA